MTYITSVQGFFSGIGQYGEEWAWKIWDCTPPVHLLSAVIPLAVTGMINMRGGGLFLIAMIFQQNIRFLRQFGSLSVSEKGVALLGLAANLIVALDLCGGIPLELRARLAADGLVAATAALGGAAALFDGGKKIACALDGSLSKKNRIFWAASGIASALTGCLTVQNLMTGRLSYLFQNREASQIDRLNLKFRSLIAHKDSECAALVIDGMDTELEIGGYRIPNHVSNPLSESIGQHCRTVFKAPQTPDQLCQALDEVKSRFGRIDVVNFNGHANDQEMFIQSGTHAFRLGEGKDLECMNRTLGKSAQIILSGCNTATHATRGLFRHLADRLSRQLPTREVTGYSTYYNPLLTTTQYIKNRFVHNCYFTGLKNLFSSSRVTLQNGEPQ